MGGPVRKFGAGSQRWPTTIDTRRPGTFETNWIFNFFSMAMIAYLDNDNEQEWAIKFIARIKDMR